MFSQASVIHSVHGGWGGGGGGVGVRAGETAIKAGGKMLKMDPRTITLLFTLF